MTWLCYYDGATRLNFPLTEMLTIFLKLGSAYKYTDELSLTALRRTLTQDTYLPEVTESSSSSSSSSSSLLASDADHGFAMALRLYFEESRRLFREGTQCVW